MGLGARTLRDAFRLHLGRREDPGVASPARAFVTALSLTASNPLTIASWAVIFSAATAAGPADSVPGAVLLVAGVGLGSAAWDASLATATAFARRAAGERFLRAVDVLAGIGLICFGGALAYSTFSHN